MDTMNDDTSLLLSKHVKIYVCHDKPCGKKKKRLKKILELFPMARKTKCMGICKGPVVLLKKDKKKYYCTRIRKKKDRARLLNFISSGIKDKKLKFY